MNSIKHLQELYEYNDWANRVLVRTLKDKDCSKALRYLSHVLVTEKEYYERLFGKDSTGFDFWKELSIEGCSDLAKENAEAYERLLNKFDDEGLGQKTLYYTSEGEQVENSFREILTHVILHSMNHRGQVLTILNEEGLKATSLDYIIYCRSVKQ